MVELIVVIALASLIAVAAFSFVTVGARLYVRDSEQYQAQETLRILMDRMRARLRYATDIRLMTASEAEAERDGYVPGGAAESESPFFLIHRDGAVHAYAFDGSDFLATDLSQDLNVDSLVFEKSANGLLSFAVKASFQKQTAAAETSIRLENLKLENLYNQIETGTNTPYGAVMFILDYYDPQASP